MSTDRFENPTCIICGKGPAVTTEGTCIVCDGKDEKGTPDPSDPGYESQLALAGLMSFGALVLALAIALGAAYWQYQKTEPPKPQGQGVLSIL